MRGNVTSFRKNPFNFVTIQPGKADSYLRFQLSGYFSTPMPQFAYRARDAQGSLVEGVLDCPDRAVAIRQIELQKCIPVRIELMGTEANTAPGDGGGVVSSHQKL